MITHKNTLTLGLASLLAAAAPVFAQTNNETHAAEAAAAESALVETAAAEPDVVPLAAYDTKYELALSYSPFGGKIRSKNVKSVTNPKTGVFCIESSVSLDLKKIYPLVSIEWGNSSGNALLAFWRDTTLSTDCTKGWLEVQTFDFDAGGAPVASQKVAFDLVIE